MNTYLRDGFILFKNVFDKDFIRDVHSKLDELSESLEISEEVFEEKGTKLIKQIQYLHQKDDIFKEMIKRVQPLVSSLIGDDASILNMQMFEKHPYISKETRAHQDNAYFKLSPPIALTVWIALDDIDKSNGCLSYTPSSHHKSIAHGRYSNHTTFRTRSGVKGLSLCIHDHDDSKDIDTIWISLLHMS